MDNVTPSPDTRFKSFSYFEPSETKVIFVGQEPIPKRRDTNLATGLSFSLRDRNDAQLDPRNNNGYTNMAILSSKSTKH